MLYHGTKYIVIHPASRYDRLEKSNGNEFQDDDVCTWECGDCPNHEVCATNEELNHD